MSAVRLIAWALVVGAALFALFVLGGIVFDQLVTWALRHF